MAYKTFNTSSHDQTKEHMFFGESVGVARFDQQKHQIFNKLTEKQIGFFWVPDEIDVTKDKRQFANLSEHEQHIFLSNIKYQILLDSVQGRSPSTTLLPIVSLPELENWIETWSFSETIHSRSYTHIIRNVLNDPSHAFDGIVSDAEIVKRAADVSKYYDNLHLQNCLRQLSADPEHVVKYDEHSHKRDLYLTLGSVNALEAIRFYVSFACSFGFVENDLMTGNGSIIKLIARDEALHYGSTNQMINLIRNGKDDPELAEIAYDNRQQMSDIFHKTLEQEIQWAYYLFSKGSMLGLNAEILKKYVQYIAAKRMKVIGVEPQYDVPENPIPWINDYINTSNVQTTPQEKELTSYIVGGVDTSVEDDDLKSFSL